MKRIFAILVCSFLIFALCACENTSLPSGNYYLDGDYETGATPYIHLDTENKLYSYSQGDVFSSSLNGTYEIKDGHLIATLGTSIYEYEIKDENTLVRIGVGFEETYIFGKGIN